MLRRWNSAVSKVQYFTYQHLKTKSNDSESVYQNLSLLGGSCGETTSDSILFILHHQRQYLPGC
jgi:hypothetical protein